MYNSGIIPSNNVTDNPERWKLWYAHYLLDVDTVNLEYIPAAACFIMPNKECFRVIPDYFHATNILVAIMGSEIRATMPGAFEHVAHYGDFEKQGFWSLALSAFAPYALQLTNENIKQRCAMSEASTRRMFLPQVIANFGIPESVMVRMQFYYDLPGQVYPFTDYSKKSLDSHFASTLSTTSAQYFYVGCGKQTPFDYLLALPDPTTELAWKFVLADAKFSRTVESSTSRDTVCTTQQNQLWTGAADFAETFCQSGRTITGMSLVILTVHSALATYQQHAETTSTRIGAQTRLGKCMSNPPDTILLANHDTFELAPWTRSLFSVRFDPSAVQEFAAQQSKMSLEK